MKEDKYKHPVRLDPRHGVVDYHPLKAFDLGKSLPFTWKPDPTPLEPGRIKILGHWAEVNITTFACEPLARVSEGRARLVTLNYQVIQDFQKLFKTWEDMHLLDEHDPKIWGGGYNPRLKRGIALPSAHAGGWAFDLFPSQLPLGHGAPADHRINQLAVVAQDQGWNWGGHWQHRPDPQHFQHKSSPIL